MDNEYAVLRGAMRGAAPAPEALLGEEKKEKRRGQVRVGAMLPARAM